MKKQLDDVGKYLDMFESIMRKNGTESEQWSLALRSAVMGSCLQGAFDAGGSYEEIREEILTTFGQTPEKLWKDLSALRQDSSESFRQLCLRAKRLLHQFIELAKTDNSLENTIVKYIVLEATPPTLRAFLMEHKVPELTLQQFQEVGCAHQNAHGRPEEMPSYKPVANVSSNGHLEAGEEQRHRPC